jgi:RNase P subunit RPR2
MTCQRCDGLMVRERYDDLELGSAGHELPSWRCLNCGAIVDPVILAHHHTFDKAERDRLPRRRVKKPMMVG